MILDKYIQSDPEIVGGYACVDRSDSKKGYWQYYIFVLNYDDNRKFLLNYYNDNEFGKNTGYARPSNDWQEFDAWYSEVFDGIYEFIFTNEADAVLFKLRWI